jgi:ADP-heptose:LPS heptosyltransferase
MGWGDEIMVTGLVRRLQKRNKLPVRVLDRRGRPRWSSIWDDNPRFAPSGYKGRVQTLVNGPGERPYIAARNRHGWVWRDWICPLGEIHLTDEERKFGERYANRILLEPALKPEASPNKDWGWTRWCQLAGELAAKGYLVSQFASRYRPALPGAELIQTKSFRQACAVISRARLTILPEGGLHHAAAAFGTASIVIFGGYISPAQTGYAHQVNLFAGGAPCGRRNRCPHCVQAMERISVGQVLEEAAGLLRVIQLD